MMHAFKILLYPFVPKAYGLVNALCQMDTDFDLAGISGSVLNGHDCGYACNQIEVGKVVKSIEEYDLNDYDYIVPLEALTDSSRHAGFSLKKAQLANQKKILSQSLWLETLGKTSGKTYHDLAFKKSATLNERNQRYQSKTPCIFIGSATGFMEGNEMALSLQVAFEQMGYSVALLSANKYSHYLGAIDFPSDYMNDSSNVLKQVTALNQIIEVVETKLAPNIILIELPIIVNPYRDGYDKFDEVFHNIIKSAVLPDYILLSMPMEYSKLQNVDQYNLFCQRNLGGSLRAVHFNNFHIIQEQKETISDVCYLDDSFYKGEIEGLKSNTDCHITQIYDLEWHVQIANDVITQLTRED